MKARSFLICEMVVTIALCHWLIFCPHPRIVHISGCCMDGTISDGSYIYMKPCKGDCERGDIIGIEDPERNVYLIKRVIAVGGEHIVVTGDSVYINGNKLDEPYVKKMNYEGRFEGDVPEGCYFVMGDNRDVSYDSRYWENPYVPKSRVDLKYVCNLSKYKAILKWVCKN